MVSSNVREFYNGLIRNKTCTDKLASGFQSTEQGAKTFSYCGDHLADYKVVYLQGNKGQLAGMDVDCDGAPQKGQENDGRCPQTSRRSNPTAFRDIVQSYGKGIEDLDTYIHSFIVFGNDDDSDDPSGPGSGGPGHPGHGGGGPGHGGGGGGGPPGHGGGGGPPGHGVPGSGGSGHGSPGGGGHGGGSGSGGHGGGGWGGLTFDPKKYGIEPLSVMAVVCDNKMFYGVWGDTQSSDPPLVGAASLSLATACYGRGVDSDGGHSANDVLYIAFPGHEAVPGRDGAAWKAKTWTNFHESIAALGDKLIQRIPGSGNWTRPPPYTTRAVE
ncbi:fungal chitosanase of glycosyl hydrolase group 75-domain-containing protein [Pestalotiopsis sp. NC0098]|nr:fungal chitosanase of glycosyl hydrolase group 75-domain-containing protein [Pestalotiopsis sp. NC0098]